jgi:hypothetical protein
MPDNRIPSRIGGWLPCAIKIPKLRHAPRKPHTSLATDKVRVAGVDESELHADYVLYHLQSDRMHSLKHAWSFLIARPPMSLLTGICQKKKKQNMKGIVHDTVYALPGRSAQSAP